MHEIMHVMIENRYNSGETLESKMGETLGNKRFFQLNNCAGGVEVAGSNPVSPTDKSSGELGFPRGFSSFLALLAELPYPRELS